MSRTRYRKSMPPGLRVQIFFAVTITIAALLVLPTTLSAGQPAGIEPAAQIPAPQSTGSVATTLQDFRAGDFAASEFADWD